MFGKCLSYPRGKTSPPDYLNNHSRFAIARRWGEMYYRRITGTCSHELITEGVMGFHAYTIPRNKRWSTTVEIKSKRNGLTGSKRWQTPPDTRWGPSSCRASDEGRHGDLSLQMMAWVRASDFGCRLRETLLKALLLMNGDAARRSSSTARGEYTQPAGLQQVLDGCEVER